MRTSIVAVGMCVALLAIGREAAGQERAPDASHRTMEDGRPADCALASAAQVPPSNGGCLACHGAAGSASAVSHSHAVDVDYADAQQVTHSLRPVADVVKRGVNLPKGRLQCVTCHDPRSPWAKWIALPSGAVPRPAAAARDENAPSWRLPPKGDPPALPKGTEVSTAPLCAACHTYAD